MTTSHDSSSHGLTLVRALLITFSLIATFVFLLGMGSGVTALLFAVGGWRMPDPAGNPAVYAGSDVTGME